MNKKLVITLISLVSILVLAACSAGGASSSTPGMVPSLNVNGTGKVYLTPDVAYINIGVHTEAENVSQALDRNSAQAQQVKDTLVSMGIDEMDIQTTAFNIYPVPQYGPEGQITSTLYYVDNTVYITVRDLGNLGAILSAVVEAGANNINSISFDVLDKATAITEARRLAIEDAKAQAQELAGAAGVELGKIISLSVYGNPMPVQMFDAKAYSAGIGGGEVPVSAGQLVIQADASLTFEIK